MLETPLPSTDLRSPARSGTGGLVFDFLLRQEFFLVSALDNIGQDHHGEDKIECRFGHGRDRTTEQIEVSMVAAFAHEHDTDDEQHEQSEHLVHPILGKEIRNPITQPDHRDTADHNCRRHDPEHIGQRHRAEDGVEREDQVHHNDPEDYGIG